MALTLSSWVVYMLPGTRTIKAFLGAFSRASSASNGVGCSGGGSFSPGLGFLPSSTARSCCGIEGSLA